MKRLATWPARIALWLFILLLCLAAQVALIEGLLRLAGYGETTRFLVRRETEAGAYYTPNRAFYQQFTALPLDRIMDWDVLDFQAPAQKDDNAFRIFVLGSSAIYGIHTSSRILEVMLRDHAPEIHWEVYNAACPGMNSHVMQAAAREINALDPDLFLVYMGNNEAVGPFGAATVLARSRLLWRPTVIRALIAANRLRMVQWFHRAGMHATLNLPAPDALMNMLPGTTDHVRALRHYRHNIETILAAARASDADTLLCTLSSNRRFMGDVQPAESDQDPHTINGVLRQLAEKHPRAYPADVAQMIAEYSEDGLPGYEFFYDNVHFNFDGNYLAARAMFASLTKLLAEKGVVDPVAPYGGPLSKAACAERLAWTPAAEYELLRWQLQFFQDTYTQERTRLRHEELAALLGDATGRLLIEDYQRAVNATPDDLYLRHALFRLLLEAGETQAALAQSEALRARHPAARVSLRAAAQANEARGEVEAAMEAYAVCLSLYPDDPESLTRQAALLLNAGRLPEARSLYRRFLHYNPGDPYSRCRLAEIDARQGNTRQAMREYKRVIADAPRHPLAYRLLDDLLRKTRATHEQLALWDALMERHPDAAEPRVRRALLYETTGEPDRALSLLRQAADLAPDDPVPHQYLGKAALAQGEYAEAANALRRAVNLNPEDGSSRLLLIQALLGAGDLDAARIEYEHCLERDMSLPHEIIDKITAAEAS